MTDRTPRIKPVPGRLRGLSPSVVTEEVVGRLNAHIRQRTGTIADLVNMGYGTLRAEIEIPLVNWEWGTEKIDLSAETHRKEERPPTAAEEN